MKRMKWKRILIGAMALFLMLPAFSAQAVVYHTTFPETVIVPPSGDYQGFFPCVVKAANGDLLLVYYWSTLHVGANGSIMMKRSTDGGATWGAAQTVANTSYDDRDPSIMALSDGTLLLSWFTYNTATSGVVDVRVQRSTDNGSTWSSPVVVGTQMAWDATSSKIIELSNGDLLIPLYGRMTGDSHDRATVVKSTDKGLTWPASSEVTIASSGTVGLNEEAIAELENGHIKSLLRSEGTDNAGYEAHSYDYGATWGAPVKLDANMHAPELFRIPGTNKIFQAWSEYKSPSDRPVMVRMGYLDRPWAFARTNPLYVRAGTIDMGYSSTVQLNATDLLTVYYDGTQRIIGGTFSKISDWEAEYEPKIDLMGKYNAGTMTVSTDMTWTDPQYPTVQVTGAFDGSTDYWHTASKATNAPAYYTIDLQANYTIGKLGIALKPGYAESALVYFSNDGVNWGDPVQSYTNAVTAEVDYKLFGAAKTARYVKVQVTASSGWATLNEIELYGFKPYGSSKIDLKTKYANGQISVNTDMNWTDPAYPDVKPAAVFDGDVTYWHSAFKGSAAPAYFTVDLQQNVSLRSIGICLKPGYTESADIYFSTDGINWGTPVRSYVNANQYALDYTHLSAPVTARYVKVAVTASSGWGGLNELELYTN